ncbi:MAG: hypothetical protein H9W81_15475 [Enterococcus sp.]|nr:hypothetical protein [Enterococcus sp.]
MNKVSDQWKKYLAKSVMTTTLNDAVQHYKESDITLKTYSIRFLHDEIAQIMDIAKKNETTFDDVVQDLIDTVYSCRFRLNALRQELVTNLPEQKMDMHTLDILDPNRASFQTRKVFLDKNTVERTCLVGKKRSNTSNKEMPVSITWKNPESGEVNLFQFFVGSTVRMALKNYSLLKSTQKLIELSIEKNEVEN